MWLTLLSCRSLADSDNVANLTKAMECLDEVAWLGAMLPPDEQLPWLDSLTECDVIAQAVHDRLLLRGEGGHSSQPTSEPQ